MVRCLMMSDEDPLWPEVGGLGMGHGVHKSLVSLYSLRFHRLGFRLGRGSCILLLSFVSAWAAGMHWECRARIRFGFGPGFGPGSH